jgi:hypothetical protein
VLADVVGDGVDRRAGALDDGSQRGRHAPHHLVRLVDRGQRHEDGAAAVTAVESFADGDGEARLADPAGAAQRDEPDTGGVEQRDDRVDIGVAADQRRRGRRQRRPR